MNDLRKEIAEGYKSIIGILRTLSDFMNDLSDKKDFYLNELCLMTYNQKDIDLARSEFMNELIADRDRAISKLQDAIAKITIL